MSLLAKAIKIVANSFVTIYIFRPVCKLSFQFFPTLLGRTGVAIARAELATIVRQPDHLLLLIHLQFCMDQILHPFAPLCIPCNTCILWTNWMAEQSPSFCISQLGKGSSFGADGILLPFFGTFAIARFRGWWLPYHLKIEL